MVVYVDAGVKYWRRKRRHCALRLQLDSDGYITHADLCEKPESDVLIPIQFHAFYTIAKFFGLTTRKKTKRSPDEQRAAHRIAVQRYRQNKRSNASEFYRHQRRSHQE